MNNELRCVYCNQPIYETEQDKETRVWLRGRWRHIEKDMLYCIEPLLLPTAPPAQCHICHTTTTTHRMICSAAGKPLHTAKAPGI